MPSVPVGNRSESDVCRPLVGRTGEIGRLRRALGDAARGAGGALVVRGEPGMGKTTLLRAAAANAPEGMAVVVVRGVEAEAEVGYAGLTDALRPALSHLDLLIPLQRSALESALALGPPLAADTLAVGSAALSLLSHHADVQPVALLVDDLHFLDTPSQLVLAFVARRLAVERVALVASVRDGHPTPFDGSDVEELRAEPLADEDAAALVTAQAAGIAGQVRDEIVRTAQGSPLALVELPSLLDADQLAGRRPLERPLRVNGTVHAAFEHRLTRLSHAARLALLVVAADDTADPAVVRRALGCLTEGDDGLAEAEREGVLSLGPPLRVRHPLLRSLAYHEASAEEQRRVHAALAESVVDDPYRTAWHRALAATGPDDQIAEELDEAAAAARARNLLSSSAAASERAAMLSTRAEERARRLVEAAGDYQLAGSPEAAATHITQALHLTTASETRAQAVALQGNALLFGGNPREACALLRHEGEAIADVFPAGAAMLLTQAVMACQISSEIVEGTAIARRAVEIAARAGPQARSAANLVLGEMLLLGGDATAVHELQRETRTLAPPDDPLVSGRLLQLGAAYLMIVGEHEKAREAITQIVAGARSFGLPSVLPYPLGVWAEIDYRTARWPDALAHASEAAEIAEQTGQGVFACYALQQLGRIEGARGDDGAEARLDLADVLASQLGLDAARFYGPAARAFLALTQGRYNDAVSAGRLVEAISRERGLREPAVVMWAPDLIESHVRLGSREAAEQALDRFESEAGETGRVWALATAARCHGLLDEEFEEPLARALEWHDRLEMPFERARTELVLGERRRRAGRRVDARAPLESALATFERLGASPWSDRARAELRAAGGRIARSEIPALGDLTAHELRVALIVARGATNREAAAELFVSPKTVDFHLQRVYRKLRVSSRTELAHLLASHTV